METYEDELFTFFTTEENFNTLCQVARHFEPVKKRLLEEFWDIVHNKIKATLKQNDNGFDVNLTGPIANDRTKIMVYKRQWPSAKGQPAVAIAIQRMAANNWPFYGPWINCEATDMQLDNMHNHALNSKSAKGADKDNDRWFPFYHEVDADFKKDTELLKILPGNRNAFAGAIARDVIDLAMAMEADLDTMASMKK